MRLSTAPGIKKQENWLSADRGAIAGGEKRMKNMFVVCALLNPLLFLNCVFSSGAEFLVYDEKRTFTEAEHGFYYFQPAAKAPDNWLYPRDYYNGEWQMRFEIFRQPSSDTSLLQFCIWADWNYPSFWRETCSTYPEVRGPGDISYYSSVPSGWWCLENNPVDFSRPEDIYKLGIVLRSGDKCIVSDWVSPPDGCWEKRNRYLPMDVRVTIVAVSTGSVFSGWENYISTNVVRTPVIKPNGGVYKSSVTVTITCATQDARIYYTLDGTNPGRDSNFYSAPFLLVSSSAVKAIAFKDGMDKSAAAGVFFTVNTPEVSAGAVTGEMIVSSPGTHSISKGNPVRFRVSGVRGSSEIKIYTISGKLVKKIALETGEREISWNTLNEKDNVIKPGIYVYTIVDSDKNKKTGKVIISR